MDATEQNIGMLLVNTSNYQIPPYQRPYSWDKENIDQLLDDTWEAFVNRKNEYFIGSIITIKLGMDSNFEVVDGQQRIASINLLLCGLRDTIKDVDAKSRLNERVLFKGNLSDNLEKPRLTLRSKDQPFYIKYILGGDNLSENEIQNYQKSDDSPKIKLYNNFVAVKKFLSNCEEQKLKEFADYILNKVMIVFVTTNSMESAFRMFNVLNARGMPLSNSDVIKNKFFEILTSSQFPNTIDEVESRWLELESRVSIKKMDEFLGHHLTTIYPRTSKVSIQREYSNLIKNQEIDPSVLLDEITESAGNYSRIINSSLEKTVDIVTLSLESLNRVTFDGWIPPLMTYLIKPPKNLSVVEFVSLLEKITYQIWVLGLTPNNRFSIYRELILALNNKSDSSTIVKIFKSHSENVAFKNALNNYVYGYRFLKPILIRLEEYGQDSSVTKRFSNDITIEHILPQSLKDNYWKERFSEDQHAKYVHCLGNLVLLSSKKNLKAQNFDFNRKKDIFREQNNIVSFDTTKEILEIEDWDVDVITSRQKKMIEKAIALWEI